VKKPKGRPKSAETIERERIEEMFKNSPPYLIMTAAKKQWMDELIANGELTQLEILKDYKTSPSIPDNHAYAMASLGDESLRGREAEIISRDNQLRKDAQRNREAGAAATKTIALKRATELCKKNRILVERLAPTGVLSASDIAKKILKEWSLIPMGSKLPGEPDSLTERGVGGDPPTERTIRSYLRQASPLDQHRVGKGFLKKK